MKKWFLSYKHEIFTVTMNKKIYLISNLTLPLLKSILLLAELWKNHFSLFQILLKIYDTSFKYFVLVLFLVVFTTIYVPHVFPPHWIKGFWYNFFHLLLFYGINKNWDWWEPYGLKRLEGRAYGGKDFVQGKRPSKSIMPFKKINQF